MGTILHLNNGRIMNPEPFPVEDRTPVIFRVWTTPGVIKFDSPMAPFSGEVIALFPTVRADFQGNILSYEAVGQYGAATLDLVLARTRPARMCEWLPLARELAGQFDYKLRVVGTDALGERGKINVSYLSWDRPA